MNEPDLTLAIATCGRPKVLRRCLNSINTFVKYPHKIIILDNTKAFTDEVNNNWAKKKAYKFIEVTDKKIGCCESNQMMIDVCDTDYIMHLDDDVYFEKNGIVTKMMEYIKKHKDSVSIVSCLWRDTFYKRLREANVKHVHGEANGQRAFWKISIQPEVYQNLGLTSVESDEALHSMIIDMSIYKKVSWDKNYSWKGDREDFFLQCKEMGYKIHILIDTYVVHDPMPFKYGSLSYEFDGKSAIEYFQKKWGEVPLFGWAGFQNKPR